MSPEENRASENLVVLCLFHSSVIDDFEDDYPAETLRSWKQDAESAGGGTELSDSEVAEVSRVWIDQPISLEAETIMVGGTLGGGGGAIGAGAFGGRGGNIAQFPEINPPTRPAQETTDADHGSGSIPGFDGQPGGPTAMWKQDDGEIVAVAGGGGGSFAGTGQRSTDDRLAVSVLLFANSVEIRNGLVYMLGGGWDTWTATAFPQFARVAVLAVIEAGHVPVGEYTVHVSLHDPSGARKARASFPIVVEKTGAVLRIPVWVLLDVTFEAAGRHALVVSTDLREIASIEIVVVGPPGGDAESG
jgi:hypothetical protein